MSHSPHALNIALIAHLKQKGFLKHPAIEQAFLQTPRHLFVPDVDIETAYHDDAIATKLQDGIAISSCSQPAIIAIMLEQLAVEPGMRVLEIGAGTGYNAALLSRLAGPTGRVTTIDIDEDIVLAAQTHLASAGIASVAVLCADGGLGAPDHAPFDRIILAVSTSDITPAWFAQLRAGGVLVLPLWFGARQLSVAFHKNGGHLSAQQIVPCGFMTLRGTFAGPRLMGRAGAYLIGGETVSTIDEKQLALTLESSPVSRTLDFGGTTITLGDLIDYAFLTGFSVVSVNGNPANQANQWGLAVVAAESDGAAIVWANGRNEHASSCEVQSYGANSAWEQLPRLAQSFIAAGQPSVVTGRLDAYLCGAAPSPAPNQYLVRKHWMEYLVTPAHRV